MGLREPRAVKLRFALVAVITAFAAASYSIAQDQPAPAPPTWQDMLAAGIVPYRQLTLDDIPVADKADAKHAFYIRTAVEPRYHYFLKPHTNGFVYAYIDQWLVFSGLNRKESWRKSKFKTMKAELPYAQALLDINEIHARQLAALKTGELPQGRGATVDEARADMEAKLKQFVEAKYAQGSAEMRALAEATKNGADKQRVKQLAAEIRKRLDATPATTVQANDAALSVNPMPSGSASPAASPSSTPAPYGYEQ
jgi:hypothetical protein